MIPETRKDKGFFFHNSKAKSPLWNLSIIIKAEMSILQKCLRKLERWSSSLRSKGGAWNGVPENTHLMICLMHKALIVQPLSLFYNVRKVGQSEVNFLERTSRGHNPCILASGNSGLFTVSLGISHSPLCPQYCKGSSRATTIPSHPASGKKGKIWERKSLPGRCSSLALGQPHDQITKTS